MRHVPAPGCRRYCVQRLATPELERLLADGAKMSEDEACRLALVG
jgi:hypothetical protein